MSETFTKVTSQNWFSRIKDAIGGLVFGIILFLVAFPLLFWNEGRAVQTARSLTEGSKIVTSVSADSVDSGNNGKLVHTSGMATTEETLSDPIFPVSDNAIKLRRRVQMFQWKEYEKKDTKTKTGGETETETTYEYKKEWSDGHIDSSKFEVKQGHQNPSLPFEAEEITAHKVTVGAFTLAPEQVASITQYKPLSVTQEIYDKLDPGMKNDFRLDGSLLYLGENPANPQIGDTKISFEVVHPLDVSVLGQQEGETFRPFQTKAGDKLIKLYYGKMTADEMFKQAHSENAMMTWILRGVGFFMMFIGLMLIANPLKVLADVLPFIGNLVGGGIFIFALMLAIGLSAATIAISWIVVRPVLGIALLLVTAGAIAAIVVLGKKKKAATQSEAA